MHITAAGVASDLFTIASGIKVALGGIVAKLWSKWLGAEKKLKADLAAAEAKVEAAVKKL